MADHVTSAQAMVADGRLQDAWDLLSCHLETQSGIALAQHLMALTDIAVLRDQRAAASACGFNAAAVLVNAGYQEDAAAWLGHHLERMPEDVAARLLYRDILKNLATIVAGDSPDQAGALRQAASELELERRFLQSSSPETIKRWWESLSGDRSYPALIREICETIKVCNRDRGLMLFRLVADLVPDDLAPALLERVASMAILANKPDLALHRDAVLRRMTGRVGQNLAMVQPLVMPTGPQTLPLRPRIGFLDVTEIYRMPNYREPLLNGTLRSLAGGDCDVFLYILPMFPTSSASDFTDALPDHVNFRWLPYDEGDASLVIAGDNLDILLLMNGYIENPPLKLFSSRPAKRLALWMHTYGTYGPNLFDAIVVDEYSYNNLHAQMSFERPVGRVGLPALICAPANAPDVSPPPCRHNGFITFGVIGRLEKLGPTCFDLWCDVLALIPSARLRLHSSAVSDQASIDQLFTEMASHHVPVDRVDVADRAIHHIDHLAALSEIDIVLDTFPFNGGLTTVEALWQGVPVVSWSGETPLSRSGLMYLTEAGLPHWVGGSGEECAAIAVALAQDVAELERLRFGLRDQLRRSRLMNSDGFQNRFLRAMAELMALPAQGWRAEAGNLTRQTCHG